MSELKGIISLNGMCQSSIKWRLTDLCNYKCTYCLRKYFIGDTEALAIKENWLRIVDVIPDVARIINELPGNVKLDLIGGECTIFNLHYLLEELFKICGEKLKRINLTTNMSQSADYYNDLTELCYKYNSEIGITCSWHYQFCSMDDFFEKFSKIKSPTNQKGIRVECVSMINNQPEVEEIIRRCEDGGFSYFIERDLRASPETKEHLIAAASSQKKDRYKILYDNGEEQLYKTRNDFLTSNKFFNKKYVEVKNYYCTRDYDYVYIEIDYHIGRNSDSSNCKTKNNIKDFHPLKNPIKCLNFGCSMCGQMSVSKNKEELIKHEE